MTAQWVRCSRCQVALQVSPGGPTKCGACGAEWRMRVEALSGNHSGAIESADRILARDPNNADAKKIRGEAVKSLRELMRKVGG
jgi:hypothetical protein